MVCFIKNLKQYDICCNFALSQSSSGEHNQHRINLKKHQEYWTQNEKRPNDLLEAHSLTSTSWHEVKAMEPRSRQCSTLTQNQPQRSKYLHALCISGLVKSLDDLVQSTPILKPSSNGWNSKTDKVQILFFNLGEGYSSSFSITYYTQPLNRLKHNSQCHTGVFLVLQATSYFFEQIYHYCHVKISCVFPV